MKRDDGVRADTILNFFTSTLHRGSWREPGVPADQWMDVGTMRALAQTAERGKFHSVFIADTVSLVYADDSSEVLARSAWLLRPEPFTLGAYLAAFTSHIGITVTASTTYSHPYNVARGLAMLDHISGGRAGWNVVTSHMGGEAANFGLNNLMGHSDRYARASEFVRVVKGLLDSWSDDAFPMDKESGLFMDPNGMHPLNHSGEYFAVAGPLNIPRPPQGHPVFAQAGSSADGRTFAAEVAEMMFTFQTDIEQSSAFTAQMKAAAVAAGRSPDSLKILPLLNVVVEENDSDAHAKLEELDALIDPRIAMSLLSQALYYDLSAYDPEGPLPDIPLDTERAQTRQKMLVDLARRDGLSIRELSRLVGAGDSKALAGSPTTIADHIEEWVLAGACDGFNLAFPNPVRSLPKFVDLVVPELQRRRIFREDYAGATLRENLGLTRPVSAREREVAR